jgi:hypothetical protein
MYLGLAFLLLVVLILAYWALYHKPTLHVDVREVLLNDDDVAEVLQFSFG